MDLDYSPNPLDTPSLITPNINANSIIFKSSYVAADDISNRTSINDRRITDESSLVISSADMKVSKIEQELKQGLSQTRQPTESPFQKLAESGNLSMPKSISISVTNDDGIPNEIPSTAEVMNVIESFSKSLAKDNIEREAAATATTMTITLTSENHRLDSSPTQAAGTIVSPKKKLLIRSQSHTEPTSPSVLQSSQTQNDESSLDDHRFQRLQDMPLIDSNTHIDVQHIKPIGTIQAPIVITTKRTFPQAMSGTIPAGISIPKPLIPAQHEVSSSGQLITVKRQKTTATSMNNPIVRSSTNNESMNNDDQRKKQIRESNREAARRCRERRRNYIEQLEGNLEQCKLQMKQLNEKLSRAERENTQLRAIITEAKIFHPSTRHSSSNESSTSMLDFVNVISTNNGIEMSNETTDGNAVPRNFIQRNTR